MIEYAPLVAGPLNGGEMVEGWAYSGAPQVGSAATAVTLLEGVSFCLCDARGDIETGHEQGLFYRDTRFLSCWRLEVDGCRLAPLDHQVHTPFSATFIGRRPPAPHLADSTLLVTRRRYVCLLYTSDAPTKRIV